MSPPPVDVRLARRTRPVGRDHRLELVGRRTVHDHRVGAVLEFLAYRIRTLLSRPGGQGLQPLVGDQRGDVLDLLGGGLVIDPAGVYTWCSATEKEQL